jgi:hypothetical protein
MTDLDRAVAALSQMSMRWPGGYWIETGIDGVSIRHLDHNGDIEIVVTVDIYNDAQRYLNDQ